MDGASQRSNPSVPELSARLPSSLRGAGPRHRPAAAAGPHRGTIRARHGDEPIWLSRETGIIMPSPDHVNAPDAVTTHVIHDLHAPLTVIKAQAQMLERWVRRTEPSEADTHLVRLAVIDVMVARLVVALDALRERPGDDG
jgi:signal transduction histidine kinase